MKREIVLDEIDHKLVRFYRNDFPSKTMAEKLNMDLRLVRNRLVRLRKHGYLKRWWDE